jgi:hypothetical protein
LQLLFPTFLLRTCLLLRRLLAHQIMRLHHRRIDPVVSLELTGKMGDLFVSEAVTNLLDTAPVQQPAISRIQPELIQPRLQFQVVLIPKMPLQMPQRNIALPGQFLGAITGIFSPVFPPDYLCQAPPRMRNSIQGRTLPLLIDYLLLCHVFFLSDYSSTPHSLPFLTSLQQYTYVPIVGGSYSAELIVAIEPEKATPDSTKSTI